MFCATLEEVAFVSSLFFFPNFLMHIMAMATPIRPITPAIIPTAIFHPLLELLLFLGYLYDFCSSSGVVVWFYIKLILSNPGILIS